MSALEVVFVSEGNCPNCNSIRAVLNKVHHEFRHVDVAGVNPADPLAAPSRPNTEFVCCPR